MTSPDARPYLKPLSRSIEMESIDLENSHINKVLETEHGPDDSYYLDHNIFHSATNAKHSVSLFIRGPAMKESAIELEGDTGITHHRHSSIAESHEQRKDVSMSVAQYKSHLNFLFGVIIDE